MKLFEFATTKGVEAWTSVDDVVMGGVSSSQLSYARDGKARFHGTLSLENGGGFASVRFEKRSFDLSGYSSLRLRVKGDGKRYQLRLQTGAQRVSYAQHFLASGDWETLELPFNGFEPTFRGRDVPDAPPLDTGDIRTVAFMLADEQAGTFELLIDEVEAFSDSAPESG